MRIVVMRIDFAEEKAMEPTREELSCWEKAQAMIKKDSIGPIYESFIKPLRLLKVLQDEIWLETDSMFARNALYARHMAVIENDINIAFGRQLLVKIMLEGEAEKETEKLHSLLDNRYTFDNIIVGPFNSMAYHAALSVADDPKNSKYNPFFIYGGVGLGKTHIANAIGNYIADQSPELSVTYISAETFMNEFIDNVTHKKDMKPMRERLRSVDVFIVDDIQFLARTTATQEEFFHTFNDLYHNGSQIIITSDRPPREIPTIEERLRTRFEQGLIVDIRKPDYEYRYAILKRMDEEQNINCPEDVLNFIASNVTENIRTLEGALGALKARKDLTGVKINLEYAQDILKGYIDTASRKALRPEDLINRVADKYNVTYDDIVSARRTKDVMLPRQICMLALSRIMQLSTTAIGHELGNRDHTTIMHGIEKINKDMAADAAFRTNIEELLSELSR